MICRFGGQDDRIAHPGTMVVVRDGAIGRGCSDFVLAEDGLEDLAMLRGDLGVLGQIAELRHQPGVGLSALLLAAIVRQQPEVVGVHQLRQPADDLGGGGQLFGEQVAVAQDDLLQRVGEPLQVLRLRAPQHAAAEVQREMPREPLQVEAGASGSAGGLQFPVCVVHRGDGNAVRVAMRIEEDAATQDAGKVLHAEVHELLGELGERGFPEKAVRQQRGGVDLAEIQLVLLPEDHVEELGGRDGVGGGGRQRGRVGAAEQVMRRVEQEGSEVVEAVPSGREAGELGSSADFEGVEGEECDVERDLLQSERMRGLVESRRGRSSEELDGVHVAR